MHSRTTLKYCTIVQRSLGEHLLAMFLKENLSRNFGGNMQRLQDKIFCPNPKNLARKNTLQKLDTK